MQALVGGGTGVLGIDAGAELAEVGIFLFTEQAFAFHIRTQANSSERFNQTHGHMAFADSGNTVGNGQEA